MSVARTVTVELPFWSGATAMRTLDAPDTPTKSNSDGFDVPTIENVRTSALVAMSTSSKTPMRLALASTSSVPLTSVITAATNGASLTATTVTFTVPVSLVPLGSETVYVKLSTPLKSVAGV